MDNARAQIKEMEETMNAAQNSLGQATDQIVHSSAQAELEKKSLMNAMEDLRGQIHGKRELIYFGC